MRELWIHSGAGNCQFLQCWRSFQRTIHEHSACCVRSLASRFATLHDEDSCATFAQGYGERKPDDASANDDHVPVLHTSILKEPRPNTRHFSHWVPEARPHPTSATGF